LTYWPELSSHAGDEDESAADLDKDFRDNKSKKRIHALALTGDSLFTCLDCSWHALGSASMLRGSACQKGHRYHIGRVHFRINATPPLYAVSAPDGASLILDRYAH
jgi:hypothetical protein